MTVGWCGPSSPTTPTTHSDPPLAVAFDSSDNLWIVSVLSVVQLSPNGTQLLALTGPYTTLLCIAVDRSTDSVYFGEVSVGVWKRSSNGSLSVFYTANYTTRLIYPTGVAVASNGDVYVVDPTGPIGRGYVVRLSSTGELLQCFTQGGAAIAIDGWGNVYVAYVSVLRFSIYFNTSSALVTSSCGGHCGTPSTRLLSATVRAVLSLWACAALLLLP